MATERPATRNGGGNGRGTLNLAELRQRTPPVDPVEACRQSLSLALFGAVGEKDVIEIAAKLKEQAKEGSAKHQKLFFDLILAQSRAAAPGRPPAQVIEREVEVERPVLVESVGAEQLRKLVALSILVNKAVGLPAVCQLTGLREDDAQALLNHDWFKGGRDGWELTAAGKQQVG